MLKRGNTYNVYHVRRTQDNSWQVQKEGFRRPHFARPSKEEAVLLAKRLAKVGHPGRVLIHGANGLVERSYSYPPGLVADE